MSGAAAALRLQVRRRELATTPGSLSPQDQHRDGTLGRMMAIKYAGICHQYSVSAAELLVDGQTDGSV